MNDADEAKTEDVCAICLSALGDHDDDDDDDDEPNNNNDDHDEFDGDNKTILSNNNDNNNSNVNDPKSSAAVSGSSIESVETTIRLACGHRYHLDCIKEQLKHAQPSHSKRLLLFFGQCQCALCGAVCDHPKLKHLTRKTDALREKVDQLIVDQLQVDVPHVWKSSIRSSSTRSSNDSTVRNEESKKLIAEGRRKYAFYLCRSCNEPYFGGTVDCADQEEGELMVGRQDRLCVGCSPQPQLQCARPLDHLGYLVWKCRYCCNVSNFVCYGSVHFCNSCHQRNSKRVRDRQSVAGSRNVAPPPLEPIPCPAGESCPFPKPNGQHYHKNGPKSSCEQVYQCICCSSAAAAAADVAEEEPGSINLLINPSGEQGLAGWRQLNPNMSWIVESATDLLLNPFLQTHQSDGTNDPSSTLSRPRRNQTTTYFVSSFYWCIMYQTIPLHQYLQQRPSSQAPALRIEVSARYRARTDCPAVFRMEALLRTTTTNRRQQPVTTHRVQTSILDAPADHWEKASLILELQVPDVAAANHELVVILHGKDSQFWQGQFGSKVTDCRVRILGTPEHLNQLLRLPAAELERQRDELLQSGNNNNR